MGTKRKSPEEADSSNAAAAEQPQAGSSAKRAGPARPHGILARVAVACQIPARSVSAAARLLDDGCSLPFIARYRKEATEGLDEVQLRQLEKELARADALEAHRAAVLTKLEKAGALAAAAPGAQALQEQVAKAESIQRLEDLYLPHRLKRATRASAARDKGLEPLADAILSGGAPQQQQQQQPQSFVQLARRFVRAPGLPSADAALAGARDIIAERAAELPDARQQARADLQAHGTLVCKLARGAGAAADEGSGHGKQKDKKQAKDGKGGGHAGTSSKAGKGGAGSKADAEVFLLYHNFRAHARSLLPHQVLAINRGEAQGVLSVSFDWQPEQAASLCQRLLVPATAPALPQDFQAQVSAAVQDGIKRLLRPSVEREVRALLTEAAAAQAVATFARNLRALLLQPPLPGHAVLGVDPAFRTGCKLAVCDPTGRVLETATIHPHPPAAPAQQAAAGQQLTSMIAMHGVTAVAIGNGVASRETQRFVAACLEKAGGRLSKQQPKRDPGVKLEQHGSKHGAKQQQGQQQHQQGSGSSSRAAGQQQRLGWCVVSEAGASVYSASELAGRELPGLDVSMRGAVSIARRLQDPLSELVKVEPASLGVGQYQHDLKRSTLSSELAAVVESVVNAVGVDLNSASPALLAHVAGCNQAVAASIVAHRDANGLFTSRHQLLSVKGLGAKTFQNAAGFLRIRAAPNALDGTAVHPESYAAAHKLVLELCASGSSSSGKAAAGEAAAKAAGDKEERPRKRQKGEGGKAASKGAAGKGKAKAAAQAEAQLTGGQVAQARPALAALLAPGAAGKLTATAGQLGVGEPTLRHMIEALLAPGRDVRGEAGLAALHFGQSIPLAELQEGMEVMGIVRNVTDFGAFVDFNAESDGLVHISEFRRAAQQQQEQHYQERRQQQQGVSADGPRGTGGQALRQQQGGHASRDAHNHAAVGDLLRLRVVSVDLQRRRVGLAPA